MPKRPSRKLPEPLAEAQRLIDEWREGGHGSRIPEELWSRAVELAGEYGTHRTSRALRLNYDTLRRRLESRDRRRAPGAPVFVDLVPSSSDATPGGGVAEMIDAEGAVVHVEWTGSGPPDLAALAAAFYGPRS